MQFSKYHGTGNDFLLVQDLDDELRLSGGLIAAACDRHRGVGADGLIRIVRGDDVDFVMDYYNADGEVAEMCGNGIRCLAKYVFERGLTSKRAIDVQTRAGRKRLLLDAEDGVVRRVTVDMGTPALERKGIPMTGDPSATFVGQPIEAGGRTFTATAVSMGNPHCVLFLDPAEDVASVDVQRIGSEIEQRPEFPHGANVEFVTVEDGRIRLRVWERGSGETMACGTGACAALVACSLAGLSGREAEVEFPGGLLWVAWRTDDHVSLTGPAVFVFEGQLSDAWMSGALEDARK
jgi:diaminopimelate epimerase